MKVNQETLVNHLKSYGFVFSNSEIYNGLSNAWDYGPLGVLIKNQLKQLWWSEFVNKDKTVVGLDSAIINNRDVWIASGHLSNFSDPLVDCKNCKNRFRADKLIEEFAPELCVGEHTPNETLYQILIDHKINCPSCKKIDWTDIRQFNLMFKTYQGVVENSKNELFLRPETAQGIFINFKNILRTTRMKLPFGVGQIGKSFRNEITPGNFIFRTREFEQMELEYFLNENEWENIFDKYQNKIHNFLINSCGLKVENLRIFEHPKEELSHYSKKTIDYQFNFPHGFSELWGLAYRTDFDLKAHMELSKKDLTYLDPNTNEKFIPHVIEPSVGVERLLYAIFSDAYNEEIINENDQRIVMKFAKNLVPYQICVLPLVNKLKKEAEDILDQLLACNFRVTYDSSGSIGKRYRRQDAIGTPLCLTVDFETIEKQTVTIRERDSMQQTIIKLSEIADYFKKYFE